VHSISAAVGGGEEPVGVASLFAAMDGIAGAKLLPPCGVSDLACCSSHGLLHPRPPSLM